MILVASSNQRHPSPLPRRERGLRSSQFVRHIQKKTILASRAVASSHANISRNCAHVRRLESMYTRLSPWVQTSPWNLSITDLPRTTADEIYVVAEQFGGDVVV